MTNMFDISRGTDAIYAFIDEDDSAVMTKVVDSYGDPVELSADEAERLANALLILADRLARADSEDGEAAGLEAQNQQPDADDEGWTRTAPQDE